MAFCAPVPSSSEVRTRASWNTLPPIPALTTEFQSIRETLPAARAWESWYMAVDACWGGGARDGRQVSDTLDGVHRGPQVDAGRGERADVPGHLGKVVDGLIRVGIQLIQGPVHLLEVGPLVLGVGQDGLHRPDLGLILLKTPF